MHYNLLKNKKRYRNIPFQHILKGVSDKYYNVLTELNSKYYFEKLILNE